MNISTQKQADIRIRTANVGDLPSIRHIYNNYVVNTTVTFDTQEQTEADALEWFNNHVRDGLTIIVAEDEFEIIGWASLSRYSARCAYQTSVEPSVYVHPDKARQGVGKSLIERLVLSAHEKQLHCLVGLVCSENHACLKWIEEQGFVRVGELKEVGRKFDRWLNVIIMQRMLSN